jgi:hypothetical protein
MRMLEVDDGHVYWSEIQPVPPYSYTSTIKRWSKSDGTLEALTDPIPGILLGLHVDAKNAYFGTNEETWRLSLCGGAAP